VNDPQNQDTAATFDADGALSRPFLLSRGYCCENGCRNCPYDFSTPKTPATSEFVNKDSSDEN
jgi:hypothetical protein